MIMRLEFTHMALALMTLLAAVVACRKEELKPEPDIVPDGLSAVASLPPMTKVQYGEDADGNLCGKWEKGDVIFAVDGKGLPFRLVVTDIDETGGTATLKAQTDKKFETGDKIYSVYCPLGTSSGFTGSAMTVDFSTQKTGGIPSLMFAEAVIEPGPSLRLSFRNAVSVVGISLPSIDALNSNRTISKVIVSGHEVVSKGKVTLDGGKLSFVPDSPSKFIEKEVSSVPVGGADGKLTLEQPVYVVVPPCIVDKVTFLDDKGSIYSCDLGRRTVEESKYYEMRGKEFSRVGLPVNTDVCSGGVFWSDMNLGATSVSSGQAAWGDMYRWADAEMIYTEKNYSSKTITLKPEYSKGFAAVAGQNYYDGSAYTKYNATDGKTVLDPVDDIVQLTYPGSGWRMPTLDEFNSLKSLNIEAGKSSAYLTITAPDGNSLAFTRPYGASGTSFDKRGRYWTSTVVSDESDGKRFLKGYYFLVNSDVVSQGSHYRNMGYYIRPVKPSGSTSGTGGGGSDEPDLPNLNEGKSVAGFPEWTDISINYGNLTSANHPRLFLRNKDIKAICSKVSCGSDPNLAKLHKAILSGAGSLVKNTTPLKYEVTVGGQLVLTSRKALLRIADLAYAYRVTGEERYLEMADWNINTVCDFPDWHAEHFLDVAEMATAVAIGYDWLYNDLPDATKEKARAHLKSFALELAEPNSIYKKAGNWNQVCLGGLICAAIAVYEDCPQLCDEVIRKSLASNAKEVKAIYAPSGACPEGPGYWEYGTTYQGILNLACETALGTDFGLPSVEGFDKTGLYYMYIRGNSGKRFNYSDSGEKNEASTGLWYMAYKLNKGYYLYQDISRLDDGSFCTEHYAFLALTCCHRLGAVSVNEPSGNIYKANGPNPVLMCRTGWKKDDLYLALKGGEANISHAHLDVGEVVFDAYGTRWMKDFTYSTDYGECRSILLASGLSADELGNREQDSWRWKFFQYHNLRHSTLTIDMKPHWPYGIAEITKKSDDTRLGGYVDLTNAFYNQLKTGNRTAVIRDGSFLEITDVLTALDGKSASVRWTCASDAEPSVVADGIVLTDVNGVRMKISTTAPGAKFSVWSTDPAKSEDYKSPFTETETLHQNPLDGYLCGFEYVIPAGTKVTAVTTLKKI